MMNEYLCRSYVAEQILDEMAPQRRTGEAALPPSKRRKGKGRHAEKAKEGLIEDTGSNGYKNWLSRSTTLEDIYRHYEDPVRIDEGGPEFRSPMAGYGSDLPSLGVYHPFPSIPHRGYQFGKVDSGGSGYGGGGGGGESGYGSAGGYPESTHGGYGSASGGGPWHGGGGGSGGWQSSGHPWQGGGGGGVWVYHHHDDTEVSDDKADKGMKLKDLFDLALTALAFLAFGAFKVQLIMCLTNNGTVTSTAAPTAMALVVRHRRSEDFLPIEDDLLDLEIENEDLETESEKEKEEEEEIEEEEINNEPWMGNSIYEWDQLALLAIRTMDAAILAPGCLRRQLCEGNRLSRQLSGPLRIWMPVWSWVSGRTLGKNANADAERMDNLKASVLGLANTRCEKLYATCSVEDLARIREERKTKRRRRRRGDPGNARK